MRELRTVGDYIKRLQEFPPEWPVHVSTQAGGGVSVEHREIRGNPVIAVFGSNGGRFGENPLTEDEYKSKSAEYLRLRKAGYSYTSTHGDHRLYMQRGLQGETCYGTHFDRRIVERMVSEGLIEASDVDIDRVRYLSK